MIIKESLKLCYHLTNEIVIFADGQHNTVLKGKNYEVCPLSCHTQHPSLNRMEVIVPPLELQLTIHLLQVGFSAQN